MWQKKIPYTKTAIKTFMENWEDKDQDPVKWTGRTLVIPGVSLSKLQLQSVVDLILSVGISDM